MKPTRKIATALALVALVTGPTVSSRAVGHDDDPFEKLKTYDFQARESIETIQKMIQQALPDKTQTATIETHLIGVLDDPNATFAGKQEACRLLWEIGTAKSVPSLVKLLNDDKTANIARYALERNSDPAAGRALRSALATSKDTVLIGIINSIGDRGDAEAANALKPYTVSTDPRVAEAAITALGKIGTPGSLAILRGLPGNSLIVDRAIVTCGERFAAMGKKGEAARVFETMAAEGKPDTIRVEALRGLVTIQSPRAGAVALADLKSSDGYVQQVAARICGTLPDTQTTSRTISAWPSLSPSSQTILLTAFAERREAAAAPVALTGTQSSDPTVRRTAIQTLSRVGGAKAVARLVEIAVKGEGSDRDVARDSLATMPGADAEQAILVVAKQGQPQERAMLMGVLAQRPSPAVVALLMETAQGADTRAAVDALKSLGRVGSAKEDADVVKLMVTTQNDDVRDAAKDTVVSIGKRAGDSSTDTVLAALPNASPAGKSALLGVLAETGGDRALDELTKAASSNQPEVKQAALTALAETWGDTRPLPTLLNIAKSDSDKSIRVQALRGYFRLLNQDERMKWEEKVDKVAPALAVAERPEEKRQGLSILRSCRVQPAVDLAAKLLNNADVFSDAADTIIYLAGPQKQNNKDLPAVKGPDTTAALDKIIRMTKDDNQRSQAQKLRS